MLRMRVDLRDETRRRIGRIEVDPTERPTRVAVVDGGDDVFLNWDGAVDDGGHLRRCVACGCPVLFREKAFPQLTGLVVIMAFAGSVYGAIGEVRPPMFVTMAAVLVLDVAILLYSRRRLVCYRCRSAYYGVDIARYHRSWDRALADRHPAATQGDRA